MKLNLGSGDMPLDGYDNLDAKYGAAIYPLPYESGSIDEVRASHVLEHFPHYHTLSVLHEWVRVLKPGGWLKIAVPDFGWIVAEYLRGTFTGKPGAAFTGSLCSQDRESNGFWPIEAYLMGGQVDALDLHMAVFNEAKLIELLGHAGLQDVKYWQSEIQDCASLPVSLNLMAQKPEVANG